MRKATVAGPSHLDSPNVNTNIVVEPRVAARSPAQCVSVDRPKSQIKKTNTNSFFFMFSVVFVWMFRVE